MATTAHVTDKELIAGIALQCPRCGKALLAADVCSGCAFPLREEKGIVRALCPEREAHFSVFIGDYERIREAEGRGSQDARYYLDLPYRAPAGLLAEQWRIRARTFDAMRRNFLRRLSPGAAVLDLGAGCGWMSYRLAALGFRSVAVDLLVNESDGLGAATFYRAHLPVMFGRVQADLTRLPFCSGQFDAALFNASLHYAESYEETLGEALRCLKTGGLLLIADTPWYAREASGLRMLAERQERFLIQFGTPSRALRSLEFLTPKRLENLEQRLGVTWTTHTPWYGLGWAFRPMLAALQGRRPPSRFRIFSTRKVA